LRLVQAALSATPINSTVSRGSTDEGQGSVVILVQVSAQSRSHSRRVAKASSFYGPVSRKLSAAASNFLSPVVAILACPPDTESISLR
jgi:hypothetical protein